jgi:hypothetical protein
MTKVSLHRVANLPRRLLVALGLGIGILTVGAIAPPPSLTEEASSPSFNDAQMHYLVVPIAVDVPVLLYEAAKENTPGIVTVTLYTPNAACEDYEGKEVAIAQDKAIPQIVHRLIANQVPELINFELAGYRIQPGPKGNTVTIDFRRKPGAERHFISLSICEQRILFGSLRQTLLKNPVLGLDDIYFTERGQPIEI